MHSCSTYQRRRPEESVLYPCLARRCPAFRDRCEAAERPLPHFVERDVTRPLRGPSPAGFAFGKVALRSCSGLDSYLSRGLLEHDFTRIHCPGCGHDRLVAFSCKGRGFCPSCGGRRMEDGAAWLCNRVLPLVPLRQLGLRSTRLTYPGAMIAVQRCGSALNLNIHFHALVLDGVYVLDAFGAPAFVALPQPTLEELHHLANRISHAVLELLRRNRIWLDEEDDEDPVAERTPMLAQVARASMAGTLTFGPAGSGPVRLRDAQPRTVPQVERAWKPLGFVLDTEVRVSAWDRLHHERLCRYLLRPPLAKGRLNETMDGKYALELKTPWANGTRIIFLSGEELVGRLTALVPPPRMHLVHFYGVLAPNSTLLSQVVPQVEEEEESLTGGAVCWGEERQGLTVRRRWVPWAKLLLTVFGVDAFQCPQCDGRIQRIAYITQPRIIATILECTERKEEPP